MTFKSEGDIIGADEDLDVTLHHDTYPTIDPAEAISKQTFRGKVVFISGASRGIGQETALQFAKAGAALAIAARKQATLDETRHAILKIVPNAQVLTIPTDVKSVQQVDSAIRVTLERFGKIDVVIPNAGALTAFNLPLDAKDPDAWWNTFEVNIRGVFNLVRASVAAVRETHGHIIVLSTSAAQMRMPFASDYATSKHAIGRLVEYIAIEYPEITTFAMHPGAIMTQIAEETMIGETIDVFDSLQLAANTMLYLASGKADWLNGKYVSAQWDLEEADRVWKDKILEQGALVSKLALPK